MVAVVMSRSLGAWGVLFSRPALDFRSIATPHGGERGSQRGNARGFRANEPECPFRAASATARTVLDQPRWRPFAAAGVAQGTRPPRLSGARAPGRDADTSLRIVLGRTQRSARR